MTDVSYHLDGQPSGTAITTANSGATTVATNGATARFDSAAANTGQCGMLLRNTDASDNLVAQQITIRFPFPTGGTTPLEFSVAEVVTWPTLPETGKTTGILAIRFSAAVCLRLYQNAAGECFIGDSTSSYQPSLRIAGSTTTLLTPTVGQKYRVKIYGYAGTGPNSGYYMLTISNPTVGSAPLNNVTHASSGYNVTGVNLNNGSATAITHYEAAIGSTTTGIKMQIGHDEIILRDNKTVIDDYVAPLPAAINLYPAGPNLTTGWTKTGTGDVLIDNDDTTWWESGDNPVNQEISGLLAGIQKPDTGQDLVIPLRSQFVNGATGKIFARLYVAGSATVLATSNDAALAGATGDVLVRFPAANISAITSGQFAAGLKCSLFVTAAA